MKKTKITKAFILALSLVLLVGSAIGISVAAEETEATDSTAKIIAQSIVHDDKIQIAFAIDATTDEVKAGTVTVEYYFDGDTDNTKNAALYADATYKGKAIFVTEGLAAQDLTSVVTATSYLNGTAVETKTYSVVQFLLTKLYRDGNSLDAKYAALYESLIDYSAKAQAVFDPDEISINDYYLVWTEDAKYDGGTAMVYNAPITLDLSKASADSVANYTFKDKWNVTVDGVMAPYATDATLEISKNTVIKPVMEVASGTGKYFNDESFDGVKLDFSNESDIDSLYFKESATSTKDVVATIEDGVLVDGMTYNGSNWYGYAIKYNDDKVYSSATYVFEADLTYTSTTYNASGNIFTGFLVADSEITTNNSCFEVGYANTKDTAAPFNYFTFFEDDAPLNMGVRYNVRVEYSTETGMSSVYINGELVGVANYGTVNPTDYNNPNNALGGFLFYCRRAASITLDNACVGVINGVVAE